MLMMHWLVYAPKGKLKHEEAIRMIANGECGVFSKELLKCFIAAAMQSDWGKRVE